MKFRVETGYLDPIEIGSYEWVSVVLPDGREITVYSDRIYVKTPQDRISHKDGKRIWDALKAPYGKVREA
jgi:hypothetical protein